MWFFCLLLMAQPRGIPTRWPIQSLAVEGNHIYTKEQILAVAGLKVGQVAGKEDFEAAQKRLEATGAFETVGYRFAAAPSSQGYAASFQVTEVEPVYPVRFEELGVPDQQVDTWLKSRFTLYGPKLPATSTILDRYVKSIEELLASKGRNDKIVGRVTPTGPDRFEIVFRPARSAPAVAEVSFQGNQVIPSTVLQNAIHGVAIGMPYTEPSFREVLSNALRPLYEARGRIRVAFPKISVGPAKDVEGLAVRVTIDEGASYSLDNVRLDNKSVVKTDELVKAGGFKTGDIANFDDVAEGLERIRKRLTRQGYMRAAFQVDRNINDAKKTVDLLIHVQEGPQFLFGKLSIEGLDLNGEAAIRNLWVLKEGKPFNADYPNYFLDQVRERGLFDNLGKTRSATKIDEQNHTVDVTLYFAKGSDEASPKAPERRWP